MSRDDAQRSHSIAGRVQGQELIARLFALSAELGVERVWIRAAGSLRSVRFATLEQRSLELDEQSSLRGPFFLLDFNAVFVKERDKAELRAYGVLRDAKTSGGLLGGRILEAEALEVDYLLHFVLPSALIQDIDPLDANEDLSPMPRWKREGQLRDRQPARSAPQEASSPMGFRSDSVQGSELRAAAAPQGFSTRSSLPPPDPAQEEGFSWASAAQSLAAQSSAPPARSALAAASGASSATKEAWPKRGDWIQHPRFGRCKVERVGPGTSMVVCPHQGVRKRIDQSYIEIDRIEEMPQGRVFIVRLRAPKA